ncbi:unnamed protein product [Polarella glacialis]|uniref:Nuclear pore complex protein NUP96 C-terminal domain-containing protein n=1 Tax=Polarella glacialis TaxID=89957 RepID=A0A813G8J7_POLGL|nr:unnamed protein product [Polarella glacialis]
MTMTFGLSAGWDDDLYGAGGSSSTALLAALGPRAKGPLGAPSSKASELLRRATEGSRTAALAAALGGLGDGNAGHQAWSGADELMAVSQAVNPLPEVVVAAGLGALAAEQALAEDVHSVRDADRGIFDDAKPVEVKDKVARQWTSSAPRTLGSAGSFRACMRGGLLALPVMQADSSGTFRLRLLRLSPGDASSSQAPSRVSASLPGRSVVLLEALVQAGFTVPKGTSRTPPFALSPLTPLSGDAKVLLDRCCQLSSECFGERGAEAFELLGALFGGEAPGDKRQVMLRLSAWLARANGRTVSRHLERSSFAASSATGGVRLLSPVSGLEADGVANARRLEAVFHLLTANSVRGALLELNAAGGRGVYFDRLAAILAACGGASASGRERRRWLRRQLEDWRRQGVPDLMGPDLWRIYSLLAGDLSEVVADTLDWRTAFGAYLWYSGAGEDQGQQDEAPGGPAAEKSDLQSALGAFETAVRLHGSSCRFRPVPSHVVASASAPSMFSRQEGLGEARPEPCDLQFNALRAAAGLLDSWDVVHYDYMTYTPDPLDVALSWHFSVVLLALQGGERTAVASAEEGFQRMTRQYCLALELQGLSEWALYVAHFVSDGQARAAMVQRLLLGHSSQGFHVASEEKPHLQGIPEAWLWRARAFRSEEAGDWPGAVHCWLRVGGAEDRAVAIISGYLLGPALMGHASAPFQRGAVEAILLAPMTQPAEWLLSVLEELAPAMAHRDVLWAELGREALGFLRHWSQAGQARFNPASVVRLYHRSEKLRKGGLGLPW